MEQAQKCPKCGANTLFHNKGVSKYSGKPYENYKCKCGFLQWVPQGIQGAGNVTFNAPSPVSETPKEPTPASQNAIQTLIGEIAGMRTDLEELNKFLREQLGDA